MPTEIERRYFAVTESLGGVSHWRTNAAAPVHHQVQLRHNNGEWGRSLVFDTEAAFLRSIARFEWREITAEEVPDAQAR